MVFVTGTNTGVGKTLLTAHLVCHARRRSRHCMAVKPFCSGGHSDTELLRAVASESVSHEAITPHAYSPPLAPYVAQQEANETVPLNDVVDWLVGWSAKVELLLVEGAGGLLSPLGAFYTFADLLEPLASRVIVVAPDSLGVLNHTLLTLHELRRRTSTPIRVALMGQSDPDPSSATNAETLQTFAPDVPVIPLPYLGPQADQVEAIRCDSKKLQNPLDQLISSDTL